MPFKIGLYMTEKMQNFFIPKIYLDMMTHLSYSWEQLEDNEILLVNTDEPSHKEKANKSKNPDLSLHNGENFKWQGGPASCPKKSHRRNKNLKRSSMRNCIILVWCFSSVTGTVFQE